MAARRGQQPVVRPAAVAHRGSGGGMRQGGRVVQVAHNGAGDASSLSSAMGHVRHPV